jgi:hypothetical protein
MASNSPTGLMNIGMFDKPTKEKKMKKKGEMFEGSKKDNAQDKKLAKKAGMSMKKYESSALDKKHDAQKSMKGLKGGGMAVKGKGVALMGGGMATRGMGAAYKKGGKVC